MSAADHLLPKAADLLQKIAAVKAQKASDYMRKQAAADAEKRDFWKNSPSPPEYQTKSG